MTHPKVLLALVPLFWPKCPPLGLGSLQAFLSEKELKTDLLDLNNYFYNLSTDAQKKEWLVSLNIPFEEKVLKIIQKDFLREFESMIAKMLQYDCVGFSCFRSNFNNTLGIANILKKRKPDIKIVLGGPEVARRFFRQGEDSLLENPLIDRWIVGEGEPSFFDFVLSKNPSEKISQFQQLKSLKDLPYPKFIGVDFKTYPRANAVPIEFSRGCIRQCNFCSEKLLFKGYRTKSIENILKEIEFHRRERDIQYFIFFDSILNGDLLQLENLCNAIIHRFGSIHWEAQIAIRKDMKIGLMEKIKKSGCYNLFIGLESGCDQTLKKMNKGYNSRQALDFFKQLKAAGLNFGVSMIMGYPGETEEDFRESLNFIIQNKEWIPKVEQVNPFTYYEGTETDPESDYPLQSESVERTKIFVEELKRNKIRFTKAFIGNLIEKNRA